MSLLASLPTELRHLILSSIPSLPTLSSLLIAYPFLTPLFTHHHRTLFAKILVNTKPVQFGELACLIFLLQHTTHQGARWGSVITLAKVRRDMRAFVEGGWGEENGKGKGKREEGYGMVSAMQDPLKALGEMVVVYQDIDAWTDAFVKSRCRRPEVRCGKTGSSATNTTAATAATAATAETAPSPTELYRIRRALWRFWVLCMLAHCPLGLMRRCSFHVEAVQRDFLEGLTPWELEELECVFVFLRDAYRASVGAESGQERGEARVRDQPASIRRLLALMGYMLDSPRPSTLDSADPNHTDPNHTHSDPILSSQLFDHARRTYNLPTSPPTIWPDTPAGVNAPNEGWLCYCRNSVVGPDNYYGMFNGLAPPCEEKGRGPMEGFQRWGYCVWDEGRLTGWDMLEGWRAGRWRIPKWRWFHGAHDQQEEEKEREEEEKRKAKEKEKEKKKVAEPKTRSPWRKVEDADYVEKKLTVSADGEVVTDDEGEPTAASLAIVHRSYR
ncbi:MAG: hypothetical protein Q9208_004223 [Pyrenodesmia sp. 3 TL-2023]